MNTPAKHEHHGHAEGEWFWACCACDKAAPDPGCDYCLETYYRLNEPQTYAWYTEDEEVKA